MFWFFGRKACGILAPEPGIEPTPPALEGEGSTTGLPGKSLESNLLRKKEKIIKSVMYTHTHTHTHTHKHTHSTMVLKNIPKKFIIDLTRVGSRWKQD